MHRLHPIGILGVIAFVLTGQVMSRHNAPMDQLSAEVRMMYVLRHIYLLGAALVNVALGLYLQPLVEGWRRTLGWQRKRGDADKNSETACGKPVDGGRLGRPTPLDWPLHFRDDVVAERLVLGNYTERVNDIVRAVQVLRQNGVTVGFPMQTADGEIIFAVGKDDLTLTADQLLELLERGELHAEGVRSLAEPQAPAALISKKAASS